VGEKLMPFINKDRRGFNLWSGIKVVWGRFNDKCEQNIANHNMPNFWFDNWLNLEGVLATMVIQDLNEDDVMKKVRDVFVDGVGWCTVQGPQNTHDTLHGTLRHESTFHISFAKGARILGP